MLSIVGVLLALFLTTQAYTTEHMNTDSFDVTVDVDFDSSCSSKSSFSLIVTVARGSSILNVLEHANVFFTHMQNFKVAYGVHPTSYTLMSINTEGDSPGPCSWKVSTDPITSVDAGVFPLGEVFVTNVGMEVRFHFTTTSNDKPTVPSVNYVSSGPTGTVTVNIEYTSSCPSSSPNSSTQVSFALGESALNTVETAANKDNIVFVLSNTFGAYYKLHSLSSSTTTPSCKWCEYFTPPGSTMYSLTADINNFIVPITGGDVTLRYEPSCGVAMDKFNDLFELRNIPFPIPPHYNPFIYVAPRSGSCNEKEDGSHCRAN